MNSRVASATPREPSRRIDHSALVCESRSPNVIDPTFGGTSCSSGPTTSVTPWIHASYSGRVSASFVENCATDAWVFAGSSP